MALRITTIGDLPFDVSTISALLGEELAYRFPEQPQLWCVKTVSGLLKALGGLDNQSLVVMDPSGQFAVGSTHSFTPESTMNYINSSIFLITGAHFVREREHKHLLLVFGTGAFCTMIKSVIDSKIPNITIYTDQSAMELHEGIPSAKVIPAIVTEEIIGYTMDGVQLIPFLKDHKVSLNTRVLTAIASLYPYTISHLRTKFTILVAPTDSNVSNTSSAEESLFKEGDTNGETLALLCLMILGKAYSRADKIAGQIAKRAKAIGVIIKCAQPTEAVVSSIIAATMWKTESLSNMLDDALAACICIKPDSTVNCEASLGELATVEFLTTNGGTGQVGGLILTQARLVYSNFHSSSIHFILPMLPQLISAIGERNQTFHPEVLRFRAVEPILKNAPYLGLRATLPEKFHIKNFPLLTYCAVNYHKAHLTTQADKDAFALYTLSDIKVHLADPSYLTTAESLVSTMTSPSIASLSELVRVLPLDKARALLTSKDHATQSLIMEQLRYTDNPGPWAENVIQRENAEYQRLLIKEGVGHIEKALDNKYVLKRDAIRDS